MMDSTVVAACVALDTGYPVARTRLRILALSEMLPQAAEEAYGQGTIGLVEFAGLTRLADVSLADLTETEDYAHIALQWDAIAADGTLFTTLLADLIVGPAGDQIAVLSLTGSYWPPPAQAAAGLAQATVGCATMTIGPFLDSVANELVHPASTTMPNTAA